MSSERIYSFSQINTFMLCPERYKFSYIEKIYQKNESIEAFMGNRIHEVLDWVFTERQNKFTTFDKLVEKFDELWFNSWHEKIFIADPRINANHIYTIGLRCLGNFCNMYGPMFTNPTVGTEIKLNFEIENYKFRGVIDRLDKTKDNTFRSLVYTNLGQVLAELHKKSDKRVKPHNFNKRKWDINGLLGNNPIWDKFWKNPELTKDLDSLKHLIKNKMI